MKSACFAWTSGLMDVMYDFCIILRLSSIHDIQPCLGVVELSSHVKQAGLRGNLSAPRILFLSPLLPTNSPSIPLHPKLLDPQTRLCFCPSPNPLQSRRGFLYFGNNTSNCHLRPDGQPCLPPEVPKLQRWHHLPLPRPPPMEPKSPEAIPVCSARSGKSNAMVRDLAVHVRSMAKNVSPNLLRLHDAESPEIRHPGRIPTCSPGSRSLRRS